MTQEMPFIVRIAIGGVVFALGWTGALLFQAFKAWAWEKFSEVLDRASVEIR